MPKLKDPNPAAGRSVPPNAGSIPRAKDPIPVANRLLLIAARVGWSGIKLIVKTAVRIPGLFVRLNTRSGSRPKNLPER